VDQMDRSRLDDVGRKDMYYSMRDPLNSSYLPAHADRRVIRGELLLDTR
jgi:hypothetical protein